MEEIVILIVQFILEIILEFFIELLVHFIPKSFVSQKSKIVAWLFVYFLLGGALGLLVNHLHPSLFINSHTFRLIHLFVSPFVVGGAAYQMSRVRMRSDNTEIPSLHAAYGFLLALGYGAIRLAFGVN